MCSIVGIGITHTSKFKDSEALQEVLRSLLSEGQIRGRRATGVAFVSSRAVNVLKHPADADNFVLLDEFDAAEDKYLTLQDDPQRASIKTSVPRPISIIGHNRYPTTGSEFNNKNNHPIICGRVVGTHNGMISNHHELFAQKKIHRIGEVDSEIIFALINTFINRGKSVVEAIQETHYYLKGGYACAFVDSKNPYNVWLFRNTAPCDITNFPDAGITIWASERRFIQTATREYDLGKEVDINLPASHGMQIDLYRNKYYRFNLDANLEELNQHA